MVDTRTARRAQFQDDLKHLCRPQKNCDPTVAEGLRAFGDSLTPSHSLTSRCYSVSSLLRQHLDTPIAKLLLRVRLNPLQQLLGDFKPSTMLRIPPAHCVNPRAFGHAVGRQNQPSLVDFASAKPACEHGEFPAGDTVGARRRRSTKLPTSAEGLLELWDSNLRHAERVIEEHSGQLARSQVARMFGSLGSLRNLIATLRFLAGDRAQGTLAPEYCELCWRLTMSALAARTPSVGTADAKQVSRRFCQKHQPGRPGSLYRTDLRYKAAFHAELQAQFGLFPSRYLVRLPAAPSADIAEIRKRAYLQVHFKIERSKSGDRTHGTREEAWLLRSKGMTQSAIARQLKISRQAVSKALKDVEERIFPTHAIARYSGTQWVASELEKLGLTASEISRLTD
ncbi:MAG: hypothetical protein ACREO4_03520 [Lysobacter sp.]